MKISKNKFTQFLFFFILFFCSIFNAGNTNIYIQVNCIFVILLFLFCIRDKNYKRHLIYFIDHNKKQLIFFLIFIIYLIFQILPLPLEFLEVFSKKKFLLLSKLEGIESYHPISFNPSNSYFQIINYLSIFIIVLILKMIFYNENHFYRLCYFLSCLGAFHAFVAVVLYFNGNQDIFIIKNSYYQLSATGFFFNRTVFSVFLLTCLISSLEYMKNVDFIKTSNQKKFFNKIYVRIFTVFITIGIICSFSKLGNFLMIVCVLYYLMMNYLSSSKKKKLF